MTGASSLPVTAGRSPTREYRALVATLPLGDAVGDAHARQCPECGRIILGEGFFFPLYRHPPERGDLYYSYVLGPTNPFVSEAFARAVGRIAGEPHDVPLSFVGWYPDDYEQACLPAFDDDDGPGSVPGG